jgi:hypothetical protein
MPVKAQNEYAPSERPARYLKRIAALTGARRFRGGRYMLAVGRKYFLVGAKFIKPACLSPALYCPQSRPRS